MGTPGQDRVERRLSAILAADVAGYSRLTGLDEEGTHVQLKDVDGAVMEEIRRRGLGLREAWRRGVFCRFGEGSVDMVAVLQRLRSAGYDSWLVVEQDRFIQPEQTLADLAADASGNRELLRRLGV